MISMAVLRKIFSGRKVLLREPLSAWLSRFLKQRENGKLLWLGRVEKVCQLMNADCRKFVFRCEIEMRTGLDCIRKCCAYSRNYLAVNFYIAAVLKSY